MFLLKIIFILLELSATFAKDRFQQYHLKSIASAPLKLNGSTYTKLTANPRDYSVVVLLTAMDPRFGCHLCREFHPEWTLLSKSWTKGDRQGTSRLIFTTLDFTEGKEIFQALGLQTAPVLLLFQPTVGTNAVSDTSPIRFDFTSGSHTAEQIYAWIARHFSGRQLPKFQRPFNWKSAAFALITSFILILFTSMLWQFVISILQSRNTWAAISLISILLFTSGHMFNHIRKVPYVSGNGHGGISYFSGGFSNQFGLETQIIAAMYGLLSFAVISLALKAPRVLDPMLQQVAVLAWTIVVFLLYSLLLRVFRIKNSAYPFWLPPFS